MGEGGRRREEDGGRKGLEGFHLQWGHIDHSSNVFIRP